MYVRISNRMINSDDVKGITTLYREVVIDYNNGRREYIMCHSDEEAQAAVDTVVNAKNGIGRVYTTRTPVVSVHGCTTDERIGDVDRQMAALAEKKRQLQEQRAYEEGCEALAALIVGGVSAIADSISRRRDKKRK